MYVLKDQLNDCRVYDGEDAIGLVAEVIRWTAEGIFALPEDGVVSEGDVYDRLMFIRDLAEGTRQAIRNVGLDDVSVLTHGLDPALFASHDIEVDPYEQIGILNGESIYTHIVAVKVIDADLLTREEEGE